MHEQSVRRRVLPDRLANVQLHNQRQLRGTALLPVGKHMRHKPVCWRVLQWLHLRVQHHAGGPLRVAFAVPGETHGLFA